MMRYKIPFNKPSLIGNELDYIKASIENAKISGDGAFTLKCHKYLEEKIGINKALLTTSCTHAMEIASILLNLKPDDEVIVPSFTFTSTVNAFVLRGARPVFVDIRSDTLNIDENQIVDKLNSRTKAIFPVHYAGIGCEMDKIMKIAKEHKLFVIEDAAQGLNAKYKDMYLGTIGHLGAYSFHETKNYTCGEGGALLLNNASFIERAEIVREKGTNRSKFFRGEADKYMWVDIGSSYLPSDILAAYLYAQLENLEKIQCIRRNIYEYYYENLKDLEKKGMLLLPQIPTNCTPNYHMFYMIFPAHEKREDVMHKLKEAGICAIFHYLPLHCSPMGQKYGYKPGDFPVTERVSGCLLRLPFYNTLTIKQQDYVIDHLRKSLG